MTTQTMQHELIRASAGTGKTFELTNRYLQLLHLGATPEELLATTFTRKAAGEIFERLGHAGIFVRRFPDRPNWLRFGVPGTDDEIARLKRALS